MELNPGWNTKLKLEGKMEEREATYFIAFRCRSERASSGSRPRNPGKKR